MWAEEADEAFTTSRSRRMWDSALDPCHLRVITNRSQVRAIVNPHSPYLANQTYSNTAPQRLQCTDALVTPRAPGIATPWNLLPPLPATTVQIQRPQTIRASGAGASTQRKPHTKEIPRPPPTARSPPSHLPLTAHRSLPETTLPRPGKKKPAKQRNVQRVLLRRAHTPQ